MLWYILRGLYCPSRRIKQADADYNGCFRYFCKNLNLLGLVWQPAAYGNGRLACFAREFPRFLVKREDFRDFQSSEKVSEIKPRAPVILIQVKRVSQILSPSVLRYNPQNSNQGTEPLLILKRLLPSTLQRKSYLCIPFLEIARPHSQFLHLCACERFIFSYIGSVQIFSCSRIGRLICGNI